MKPKYAAPTYKKDDHKYEWYKPMQKHAYVVSHDKSYGDDKHYEKEIYKHETNKYEDDYKHETYGGEEKSYGGDYKEDDYMHETYEDDKYDHDYKDDHSYETYGGEDESYGNDHYKEDVYYSVDSYANTEPYEHEDSYGGSYDDDSYSHKDDGY